MPGIEAPLSVSAACVHGYVAASDAVLALDQADDFVMVTVAVSMPGTEKELAPQTSRASANAIRAWIGPGRSGRGPA